MVDRPDDGQEADVERGNKVVRLVEGRGQAEGEPQGKEKEAGGRDQDREHDAPGEGLEVFAGAAEERGAGEEEVDGHIGDDQGGDEGNSSLPLEVERPDILPQGSQPVGAAVHHEEERPEEQHPEGPRPRLLPLCRRGVLRVHAARPSTIGPSTRFRATETEKIPPSSISMRIFSNPAARTSSSSSACGRRRMTHGRPSRLTRTRATSSTWGCTGWLV